MRLKFWLLLFFLLLTSGGGYWFYNTYSSDFWMCRVGVKGGMSITMNLKTGYGTWEDVMLPISICQETDLQCISFPFVLNIPKDLPSKEKPLQISTVDPIFFEVEPILPGRELPQSKPSEPIILREAYLHAETGEKYLFSTQVGTIIYNHYFDSRNGLVRLVQFDQGEFRGRMWERCRGRMTLNDIKTFIVKERDNN
ncbi:MAG: hypothetical protein COA60_006250 [Robiginitomaculum sp.]|nr:hypothetical protein [Robiginitomaculum sp.]